MEEWIMVLVPKAIIHDDWNLFPEQEDLKERQDESGPASAGDNYVFVIRAPPLFHAHNQLEIVVLPHHSAQ
jgi:hypothetical protein